jgi:NAD-dependent SIR2 family protein deacetylase
MADFHSRIAAAGAALASAEALVVTAGAGIGVDSGLPDFRGDEGFWKAYPPLGRLGISFVSMANPTWFERDPALAWGFYGHRLHLYRETRPHSGFALLRTWAEVMPAGHFVFTSNVDGQFQKAGLAASRIVECHGSIHHLQCCSPCTMDIWDGATTNVVVDPETFRASQPLPRCPHCDGLARPNVLMFGDWSWIGDRHADQERRFQQWLGSLSGVRLVVIEIGAGSAVPTVRMTSEKLARRFGGTLIRINPRECQVPGGQIGIPGGASETLHEIGAVWRCGE